LSGTKFKRIVDTLLECVRTFVIRSLSALLRMRDVSDKCCRENQNTNFMSFNFFPEIRAIYEIMVKTDDSVAHALYMLYT